MGSVHTGPLRDSWRPRRSKEREEQERKEEAREAVSSGPREAERGERRALFGNVLQSDVGFRRRDGGRVETTGGGVEHVAQDRYGAQRRPPAHNRTLSVSSSISTSLVRRSGQPSSSSSGIFVRRGERAREERATLPLGAKRAGSGVPTAQAHAGKRSDRKILACETLAKDASESGRGDFFDEGERERRKDENLLLTLPASAYPPSPLYPGIRLLPQSLRSRSAFQHFSGLVDLTTISPLSPPVASEPSSQLSRGGTDTAMNGPSNGVSGRRSAENARLDATNRKEDEAEEGDEGDRKSEVSPPDVALGIQKEVRVSEKRILDGHERMAGSNSSCNGTESAGVATEVQESSACEEESVTTRDIASESAFDQAAFRAMGVTHPSLLASLEQAGISTPTAIQRLTAKSLLLSQEDRVPPSAGSSAASGHGCAREMVRPAPRLWLLEAFTGSGKTLAFLLPILQQMLENATPFPQRASIPSIEALILAPGRELAAQIYAVCRALIPAVSLPLSQREEGRRGDNEGASSLSSASPCSSELPVLRPCLLVGGANPERQVERLKRQRPNIVIATPGRLLSFLSSPRGRMRRLVNLRLCTSVVLDEVDALLEEKPLLAASVVKTSEETSVLPPTEERVDSVGEEGDCGGKVDRGTGVDLKCGATHRSGEEEKRAKLEKKRRERLERAMRKQLEALLSRWEARKRFEMWKERKAQREEEEHILGRLRQKGHGESEEAAWKAREEEEASWRVLEELKTRDGTKKKVSFAEQEKHFQTERAKYLRDTQERLRRKLEAQLATPIGADRPGTLRDVQAIMRHLAVNWQRRETADGGVRTLSGKKNNGQDTYAT
uniref:Helicase ATP-binding domain-containing protein n=2 Tax=Neospora caninum (strain Liverpool) TaxID=572307 RepID=A0A0F7UT42_NEOCL|nr:TPA: hypothetical protein BN1204_069030 [Neospora caninum Liverpool]